jgi:hypothetical protein
MEVGALDRNDSRKLRHTSVDLHGFPQPAITHHPCLAANPQRFAPARNEKYKAYIRIDEQILKRVEAAIAGSVRDGKCCVIKNADKSGFVAFGRRINASVHAGRSHHDEGRFGDEPPARTIEYGENLTAEPKAGPACYVPEVLFAADNIIELIPHHHSPPCFLLTGPGRLTRRLPVLICRQLGSMPRTLAKGDLAPDIVSPEFGYYADGSLTIEGR